MTVPTEKIPQADRLVTVRRIVGALAAGATELDEVADIAELSGRHARYYLNAAATLGLVANVHQGIGHATSLGTALLETPEGSQSEAFLFELAIEKSDVIRELIGGSLMTQEVSLEEIATRLKAFGLSASTAKRRARTLDVWKKTVRKGVAGLQKAPRLLEIGGLSKRAQNALATFDIATNEDLQKLTLPMLDTAPNCGEKTVTELLAFARANGITVAATTEEHRLTAKGISNLHLLHKVIDFHLSPRAHRVLETSGIEYVGELVERSPRELRQAPNCGETTVKELQTLLRVMGVSLGAKVAGWNRQVAARLAKRLEKELSRERRSIGMKRFPVSGADCVSGEIDAYIRSFANEAAAPIVAARLSLVDGRVPTLQLVGDRFGLTRERVRQVLAKFRDRAERSSVSPQILPEALALAANSAPLTAEAFRELLLKQWPKETVGSPYFYTAAAQLFQVPCAVETTFVSGAEMLVLKTSSGTIRQVQQLARSTIGHWGCTTNEELIAKYEDTHGESLERSFVVGVARLLDGFEWLDEETGWFWISGLSRNRLRNRIDKILSVSQTIDLVELREGIRRDHHMDGFAPPLRVLRAICERLSGCSVAGNLVHGSGARMPEEELSESERALGEILAERGRVLSVQELEKAWTETGRSQSSLHMNLFNSSVIRRFATSVYGIVGSQLSPGQVEALVPKRTRRGGVLHDHGWTDGGKLWVEYRLSSGAIRSGVLSIPSAIRDLLTGEYSACGPAGLHLTTLTIKNAQMWGMLRYFGRRGVEPGDELKVTFDLQTHGAVIERSDGTHVAISQSA